MKYLPWILTVLLALVIAWTLFVQPLGLEIGTVDLAQIVDESPRAQELNELLGKRYNELIIEFNLEVEPTEEETDRAERERLAYAEYLAYRQELEEKFQGEVNRAVQEVAKRKKVSVVIDNDVVRFGGLDLSSDVIKRLQ